MQMFFDILEEQSVLQMKKQETGRWDPKKACKTKTWSIKFSYQMQEKLNYDVNGFKNLL